jgi:hypothetical protein
MMMDQHTDLWYTIGGQALSIRELLPDEVSPSTPLHAIGSIYGTELFCNPWGNGSKVALARALAYAADRASQRARQHISLDQAIEAIEALQTRLEVEIAREIDSPLVRTYIDLKGVPISEIRESVQVLRTMLLDLQGDQASLRAMLDTENPARFFATHDVIPKFGLVASGNLGLLETTILIWIGVLAQAARNGNQFSLTIKPSIYDFLFDELVQQLPKDARSAFLRITWRSGEDIIPDSTLINKLVNEVDGAVYFGNRNTLVRFRNLIEGGDQHHYFYYDHFPTMIVRPGVDPKLIAAAARIATTLAYKQRGESCLSLQDVFVHKETYAEFVGAIMQEWRRVRAANSDPTAPDTLLSSYSRAHLESIAGLGEKLDGAVVGQVYPQGHRTDLIINHEITADNWVLATENAAPLLCVAEFSDEDHLLQALRRHLHNSTSDKFIYVTLVSPDGEERLTTVCDGLASISHRLEILASAQAVRDFTAYALGIPHCGGISFLADIFGLPHRQTCYFGQQDVVSGI